MFKTTMKKNSESESVKERAKIKMSPPRLKETRMFNLKTGIIETPVFME